MIIAVASGKGGTGKTTVSTGLFYYLKKYHQEPVQLVDCDVEEPNCHVFLDAEWISGIPVNVSMPEINKERCTFCGKCKEACAFNAIIMLPSAGFIEVVNDMCHACGVCSYVCPENAIHEVSSKIGEVNNYRWSFDNDFSEGRIKVGNTLQTRVIRQTLKYLQTKGVVILDAPPGTSCPVVAVVTKADYVVMVTEPTPFGLYDLKLMNETVRQINKRHGVVINKAGLKYDPLYQYLKSQNIPVIGEIPFKREYARLCSEGKILPAEDKKLEETFGRIFENIMNGK
jgi:MinD superfamily P-loop ATPase